MPTIFLKGSKTSSDITNKVNGLIAEDEKDFAQLINETMTNDNFYKKISEGCYKDVYKNWDNTVKDVYNIYLDYIKKV